MQIAASEVPVASRWSYAEPEHQQRDDDRPAAHAEQRAECARRRCDRGEAREPGGHRGAYYGRCPLRPQTRSRRRCARCAKPRSGRASSATSTARSRRSSGAPRTPTCARRCRSCWAGWPAATAAWRASPGARRPRPGAWWAWAGSPTPAPTAPSCSSPAPRSPRVIPAFKSWERRVRRFAAERDTPELRLLRVRIEDKGPIAAFHWRGVPDEEAALHPPRAARPGGGGRRARDPLGAQGARGPAAGADRQGPGGARPGGGRRRCAALYGGDDATDLDAFDALDELQAEGVLDAGVRVGVRSDEGPAAIVERADLVVDGVDGFTTRAGGARRGLMRFRDFLRIAVLLFGGAATALAAVVGGRRRPRRRQHAACSSRSAGGCSPPPPGCGWGAAPPPRPGIAGLLADARRANTLPEFEPGTILFNRLWPLAVLAVAAGALGVLLPAGAGGRGRLRPAGGAALAQAVRGGGGDRGARRRGVLDRPQLAVRPAAAAAPAGHAQDRAEEEAARAPVSPTASACAACRAASRCACSPPGPWSARRAGRWPRRSACSPAWSVRWASESITSVTPASAAARA